MSHQKTYKLAILNSHPIQYFAPLYQRLAQEEQIDLTVYYCSRQGLEAYVDQGFGETVKWDVDLLSGYHHKFLANVRDIEPISGFSSLVNLEVIPEIREGQYDAFLVHGHNYLTYHLAWLTARFVGTALLMRSDTHLLLQRSLWKKPVRRLIMTAFYSQFSGFLAIGSRNADYYRHHGVPSNKIHLTRYAVNNDFFISESNKYKTRQNKIREKFGISESSIVVLYASKLSSRKHPMHLLQAYHKLLEQDYPIELVYAGSGEEEEILLQYANENNLTGVYFLGFRNQTELPAIYAISDIFVPPAENEPWGLIINEVMCAGLPVVACDEIGAVPDLVHHGKNGYTFRVGDIEMLTEYLKTLCADGELRAKMGQTSRTIIEEWNYEEAVKGILSALESIPS